MTNPQVIAARKVMNPLRSTIKLDTVINEDGSETLTPYRITDPSLRGTPVTISKETAATDVMRLFTESVAAIPQE